MDFSIKKRLIKVANLIQQRVNSETEIKMNTIKGAISYQQGILRQANLRVAQAIQTNININTAIQVVVKASENIEFLGKELEKITKKTADATVPSYTIKLDFIYKALQDKTISAKKACTLTAIALLEAPSQYKHSAILRNFASELKDLSKTEDLTVIDYKKILSDILAWAKDNNVVVKTAVIKAAPIKTVDSNLQPILPKDLKALTEEQKEATIKYLAALSLKKLRSNQTLIDKQIQKAYSTKNTSALENLNVMRDLITFAVMKKEFGKEASVKKTAADTKPKPQVRIEFTTGKHTVTTTPYKDLGTTLGTDMVISNDGMKNEMYSDSEIFKALNSKNNRVLVWRSEDDALVDGEAGAVAQLVLASVKTGHKMDSYYGSDTIGTNEYQKQKAQDYWKSLTTKEKEQLLEVYSEKSFPFDAPGFRKEISRLIQKSKHKTSALSNRDIFNKAVLAVRKVQRR